MSLANVKTLYGATLNNGQSWVPLANAPEFSFLTVAPRDSNVSTVYTIELPTGDQVGSIVTQTLTDIAFSTPENMNNKAFIDEGNTIPAIKITAVSGSGVNITFRR